MTPEKVAETRALLAPGYRLCAPHRTRKGRHRVKPIWCFRIKPEAAFVQRADGPTNKCLDCRKKQQTAYYKRDKKAHRERVARWKADNPDLVKTYHDKSREEARKSEDYRERERERQRKLYAADPERHKAYTRRYRAKQKRLAYVMLPREVVLPYLKDALPLAMQEMRRVEDPQDKATIAAIIAAERSAYPGLSVLARWMGHDPSAVKRILDGGQRTVSQEAMDRLSGHCDFTLQEILERTKEWAVLTEDSWPFGYRLSKPDQEQDEQAAS